MTLLGREILNPRGLFPLPPKPFHFILLWISLNKKEITLTSNPNLTNFASPATTVSNNWKRDWRDNDNPTLVYPFPKSQIPQIPKSNSIFLFLKTRKSESIKSHYFTFNSHSHVESLFPSLQQLLLSSSKTLFPISGSVCIFHNCSDCVKQVHLGKFKYSLE